VLRLCFPVPRWADDTHGVLGVCPDNSARDEPKSESVRKLFPSRGVTW
jgi:hypothetical protein